MSIKTSSGIILFILVIFNTISGGLFYENLTDIYNSDDTEAMKNDAVCMVGLGIIRPVFDLHGILLPYPSPLDIFVTLGISLFFIFIYTTFINNETFKIRYAILTMIIVWIFIKLIALTLIYIAGENCINIANSTNGVFSIFYTLGAIGTTYGIFKFGLSNLFGKIFKS